MQLDIVTYIAKLKMANIKTVSMIEESARITSAYDQATIRDEAEKLIANLQALMNVLQ